MYILSFLNCGKFVCRFIYLVRALCDIMVVVWLSEPAQSTALVGWLSGRTSRSLAGELSLVCIGPAADG